MSKDEVPPLARAVFVQTLLDGDESAARAVAVGLRDRGVDVVDLIVDLIAPALEAVGLQWERATASVAVEHRATAIAEGVLQELIGRRDGHVATQGRVLLSGVEGEWHTMPGRMVAAVWRALRWDVCSLTPALPADDLAALVAVDEARIAAVSCALPANLLYAWQTIGVLRAAGHRVLVGGRAFDAYPEIAAVLGADVHCQDPLSGHEVLQRWVTLPDLAPRAATPLPGLVEVAAMWDQVPRLACDTQTLMEGFDDGWQPSRESYEDVMLLVRTALCSAALGAPQIFADHLRWYQDLLGANGLDPGMVAQLIAALDRVLPADAPAVRDVLLVTPGA